MKSKTVAISAISSALIAIALTVGVFFEVADLFALAVSSAFVIIPLYKNSYLGCFLSYLIGGVIALIFSGFNIFYSVVFPAYFLFFGIYPILRNMMQDKKNNRLVPIVIGLLWCVLAVIGIFYYYTLVIGLNLDTIPSFIPQFVKDYFVFLLVLFAVVFYFIFDRYVLVMRVFFDRYLTRISKR